MAEEIRWGILGTGSIAKKFAQGLMSAEGANLVAVGSRSQQTASTFADQIFELSRLDSRPIRRPNLHCYTTSIPLCKYGFVFGKWERGFM